MWEWKIINRQQMLLECGRSPTGGSATGMKMNDHTLQFIVWSFLQISKFCWVVVHPVPDGLQTHPHTVSSLDHTELEQH